MNHRQQAAFRVVFAWCLAGVYACGGGGTPQQPENTTFIIQTTERLQGLPETYAPNRPIYGYHMFDQPGATGSVTQVSTVSNSLGKIYVVDGRVPARWHLVWTAYPCQGRFWEGNIPGGQPPSPSYSPASSRPAVSFRPPHWGT